MRLPLSLAASFALVAFASTAHAADLQPGQYKTQVTSDIPGDKPQSQTQCITQKDIDSGLSEKGVQKGSGCKIADFNRGSGSVSYRVMCNGAEAQKVSGTFSGDHFDLKMQVQIEPGKKPNTVNITGQRTGACSKQKD
jgi:hypothetical protein